MNQGKFQLAPALGLEPRTTRVTAEHSAIELDRNLELSEDARGYARDKPCDEPAAFRPSGVGFDNRDLRLADFRVVNRLQFQPRDLIRQVRYLFSLGDREGIAVSHEGLFVCYLFLLHGNYL